MRLYLSAFILFLDIIPLSRVILTGIRNLSFAFVRVNEKRWNFSFSQTQRPPLFFRRTAWPGKNLIYHSSLKTSEIIYDFETTVFVSQCWIWSQSKHLTETDMRNADVMQNESYLICKFRFRLYKAVADLLSAYFISQINQKIIKH